MTETTEGTARSYLAKNAWFRRNKLIFFVLNLPLIVPSMVSHGLDWGCGGAVVILLMLLAWTVRKSDANQPASRNLPLFGLADVCILLGLSYQELINQFHPEYAEYILHRVKNEVMPGVVLALALAVSIPLWKKPVAVWVGWLGRAVAGGALIRLIWRGAVSQLQFFPGMDAFLAFYTLCAVGWCILCAVAYYVDSESIVYSTWLSWLLLAAFFVLCFTETALVQQVAGTLEEWLLAAPGVGLAWWKALLMAAVLAGCAVATYDYDRHEAGVDSVVLAGAAGGVLLLRVLLSQYFTFSCVIFLAFLAGCFRCLYHERQQTKTLRLPNLAYLAVQLVALVLAIQLLRAGLWVLVILMCVYALIFYTTAGRDDVSGYRLCHWLVALSCPAALAVGYIWRTRFAWESCMVIGVAYAVFACAMIILNWPHPDNRKSPDGLKWTVCGFMALLCLLSVSRYGAKIQVTFDGESNTAVVALEARGENNRISSARLSWNDPLGDEIGGETLLSAGETTIPIKGERLTIVATDAFGTTTTTIGWYPQWLLEWNERSVLGK